MKLVAVILLAAVIVLFTVVTQASTVQVSIKDFKYAPAQITIHKGDTVTWTNLDPVGHDVTFSNSASPTLKTNESYSKTFNQTGTFDYICSIHPYMKGTVIVK
jgi:amicyanin